VKAVPEREGEAVLLEQRIGASIPASLRELLVSDAWPDLLRTFSNSDQPLDVGQLGTAMVRWRGYDAVSSGVLPFMVENQGVCVWALRLSSGDDPPVVVEVDSGDPPTWQTAADSFSMWLRCQVEDYQVIQRAMFAAQAEPLTESARGALVKAFTVGPATSGWPAREIIRLNNHLGSLLLWNGEDQCDWWIAPASPHLAAALLDHLPPLPDLPGWIYELRPDARPVLEAWRHRLAPS
jgi:hypothetical protein